jgi:hypothetical protein
MRLNVAGGYVFGDLRNSYVTFRPAVRDRESARPLRLGDAAVVRRGGAGWKSLCP